MLVRFDEYISGGYIVTRFADGAKVNSWMRDLSRIDEDLLPEKFLSVGFCTKPEAPLFDWNRDDYAGFSIATDQIEIMHEWTNARFDEEIGFPNIFLWYSTAREFVHRFIGSPNDVQLLGIGLHRAQLGRIAELEKLNSESSRQGFVKSLKLNQAPEQGEILGYDVICCYYNIDHSWHCSNLPVDGLQQFGFRPNQFGLIDDKSNAEIMADYANELDAGGNPIHGEEGVYLPVLVTRYSTQVEE
jgi:hypothetical protein